MKNETTIIVKTTDVGFQKGLNEKNIPDVRVAKAMSFCDSADYIPTAGELLTFFVTVSGSVAISLFSSWLYERIRKQKPNETIINNVNITDNREQITIVINQIVKESGKDDDEAE